MMKFPCSYSFYYEIKTFASTSGCQLANLITYTFQLGRASFLSPESTGGGHAAPAKATRRARPETAATASLGGEKLDLIWNLFS